MNCGGETLTRAEKFEETSTVNKQLATANLLSCGEWRPFCQPAKTACYRNHGDAVSVVLPSDWKNRFTRLVETASLLGTSLGQFASAGFREKAINAYTLIYPFL
ncbi:hypothetical protein CHARACLAT_024083 [Characodon lateralis]|uniref:Uncharacterized protein n=1 Tax=Characodon lateralis TaxID=208331 RepID=A0ABU7F609_9TELE|nr:hypothetical protein [Characodon lateralis]